MTDPGIVHALLAHFDACRRDLPWRETSDPYAILVSEVMLQQTRVDTVRPYYERWMERFPTVGSLAEADLDEVLTHWQGLGYYSRARNLHRAVRLVRERFAGEVPSDLAELRSLPGIGEYTAGAVASIAHGVPTAAVDGNVRRVLARLWGLEYPGVAEIRRLATALVPADRPGDFNQALMELGATVCTPRSPDCGACPVADRCRARAQGAQERWPRSRTRGPVPEETVDSVVLVRDDGAMLLVRRPVDGFLGGMWEFPGLPAPVWVTRLLSGASAVGSLDPVRQAYTHKTVTYRPTVYALDTPADRCDGVAPPPDGRWVPPDRLDGLALPAAQHRIAMAYLAVRREA